MQATTAFTSSSQTNFFLEETEQKDLGDVISDSDFMTMTDAQKLETVRFWQRRCVVEKKQCSDARAETQRVTTNYQKALSDNTKNLNIANSNLSKANTVHVDDISSNSKWTLAWKILCMVGTALGVVVTVVAICL
jgi:hypothetical protein